MRKYPWWPFQVVTPLTDYLRATLDQLTALAWFRFLFCLGVLLTFGDYLDITDMWTCLLALNISLPRRPTFSYQCRLDINFFSKVNPEGLLDIFLFRILSVEPKGFPVPYESFWKLRQLLIRFLLTYKRAAAGKAGVFIHSDNWEVSLFKPLYTRIVQNI